MTTDVRSCIRGLAHTPAEVPPILLVYLGGRLFLNDGHHRLVASRMLGVPVWAEVHGLPDVFLATSAPRAGPPESGARESLSDA